MNSKIYTQKFIAHVLEFINSHKLCNEKNKMLVAVSGGVDSIALLFVLEKLFGKKIEVLHFNHGTRAENDDEESLVKSMALNLGLKINVIKLYCDLKMSNFENYARDLRNDTFKKFIKNGYQVFTAHHLDDSFEWSMMQTFKQSNLKSTLGIPIENSKRVRPFLCVSKKQILKLANYNELKWLEDESNKNDRFERNYFRLNFQKLIESRYPNYLKHYVARQNALAYELKLHRKQNIKSKNNNFKLEKTNALVLEVLESMNENDLKEFLKKAIFKKSNKARGEINFELEKLLKSFYQMKQNAQSLQVKGPMSFSGGVKIFVMKNLFLVLSEQEYKFYEQLDEEILCELKKGMVKNSWGNFFPYLVLLEEKHADKSSKQIHPLLPKSINYLKHNKIPYHFLPLISKKSINLKK